MDKKGKDIPQEYFTMRKSKKDLFKMYVIRELHRLKEDVTDGQKKEEASK